MDDRRLTRIENQLDMTNEHLASIDVTLMKQHVTLQEHMKRSEMLEAQVEPMKIYITELKGVIKFLKIVGILAAIAESLRIVLGK